MPNLARRGAILVVSLAFAASSSAIAANPAQSASGGVSLNVPLYQQRMSNWCWAATTESIVMYLFGMTYLQCTQAKDKTGRGDCCNLPYPSACNQTASLANVSTYLNNKKAVYTDQAWALSWSDTTAEIGSRGRPFWIRWGWGGSWTSGHIVVARGYYWHDSGTSQISTMDPGDAQYKWYSWSWFTNNSTFTWTNSLWKARR